MILATITDSLHVDEVGEQEVVGRIRELSMSYTFRTKGRDSRVNGSQRFVLSYSRCQ